MTSCVLAMESGGSTASVALIDPQGNLHHASAASGQSHSSQLLPLAQSLLNAAGLTWQQLDGIAVGVGPGSFTGLRIACGIAQGLALGADKRLLAVTSFEAWSYAWWRSHRKADATDAMFDVSFDARLGERFHALLALAEHDGELTMRWVEPPSVVAQESWGLRQRDKETVVLADCDQDGLGLGLPLAAWMARFAIDPACRHAHQWVPARELVPLYVRDKVAQTIEERQQTADLQWSAMTERDIASVMVIENQSYPFPWTSGNFLDSLRAGYEAQVLKERGVMIGYLVWMRVLHEAHLLNITLSPARQGHGMGAWMMRQFIARLKAFDIDEVMLEVRPSNAAAIALYRKSGFEQIGIRKGYYPNNAASSATGTTAREDAIVMRLTLNHDLDHPHARQAAIHATSSGREHA